MAAASGSGRDAKSMVPPVLADWLSHELDIDASGREAEWSADEIYVALPRPGGDAWVSLALDTGETQYEKTTRGVISYLTTCTRAATLALRGASSWICSRWPAWCSA